MEIKKSMKKFYLIWFGQLVSIIGSGISSFGLSLWVYDQTGSVSRFVFTFLFIMLPGIIFSPIAGSFADRKNRKKIIIITDALDAVLKLIIVYLLIIAKLEVWMIYLLGFLSSTLSTFQSPAFGATIPLIVPKESLGKANGMIQFLTAMKGMVTPILGAVLYTMLGLTALFIIDFATFFVAIFIMLFQQIPQVFAKDEHSNFLKTISSDFKFSINYIKSKSGFMKVIFSFTILNFIANLVLVLIGPLVMANYNKTIYGFVDTVLGVSLFIGGILASVIPSVNKKVRSLYLSLIVSGIGLAIIGISANWISISIGVFLFMILVPYANRAFGTLVQMKVENTALGRVSAIVSAMLQLVSPIAVICAGLLADNIFIPMFENGGSLSGTIIDTMLGAGNQRGIGFMFIICGILLLIFCISMLFNRSVMRFEIDNPDVINE